MRAHASMEGKRTERSEVRFPLLYLKCCQRKEKPTACFSVYRVNYQRTKDTRRRDSRFALAWLAMFAFGSHGISFQIKTGIRSADEHLAGCVLTPLL